LSTLSLVPLAGINTVAEDTDLRHTSNDASKTFVRDAVNMDIQPSGRASLRTSAVLATATAYKNIWQSPLHGDVFATLGTAWVLVNPANWSHLAAMAVVGEGDAYHELLNNAVCVAAPAGIFVYDGTSARKLTIDTPAAPMITSGSGALEAGTYGAAIAWMRGAVESATSDLATIELPASSALQVVFPLCLDASITAVRLYLTRQNGGELLRYEDFPINTTFKTITLAQDLGAPPQFQYMAPMPTGKYLKYWRGRLITAQANILRFSEPLAYHIHDERHGFVLFPQRITFVQPVDGGIWVGQVTHAVFLSGATLNELNIQKKGTRPPVPNSALLVDADTAGPELSQGGSAVVIWLAENGYVVGGASGNVTELHTGVLSGITGISGTSVVVDQRLITAVT